ncbi:MAG: Gfo/Idh/MocA family oxidoreductase [Nitrospinota bacterium]
MNVLVVGTGSIAKRHIQNLQELTEITRIFIYSSRGHLPTDISNNKTSIQKSLQNLNDIDFAIIANETQKHLSTATVLGQQGIHLFLEKPVSHKIQEAKDFEKVIKTNNIKVFIGYNLRFLGAIQFLKKEIEKGFFGEIFFSQIEVGQYLPDWRPGRNYKEVYSAKKDQGGGVALELSHELDYMMYLFGFPKEWHFFSKKVSNLEIETDDIFEGIFVFQEGQLCNVHLDYLQRSKKRTFKIVGSGGTAVCDLFGKHLVLSKPDFSGEITEKIIEEKSLFDIDKTYKDELKSFINSIKNNSNTATNFNDGLRILKLLQGSNVSQ